jgi:hypothetical protein
MSRLPQVAGAALLATTLCGTEARAQGEPCTVVCDLAWK